MVENEFIVIIDKAMEFAFKLTKFSCEMGFLEEAADDFVIDAFKKTLHVIQRAQETQKFYDKITPIDLEKSGELHHLMTKGSPNVATSGNVVPQPDKTPSWEESVMETAKEITGDKTIISPSQASKAEYLRNETELRKLKW